MNSNDRNSLMEMVMIIIVMIIACEYKCYDDNDDDIHMHASFALLSYLA